MSVKAGALIAMGDDDSARTVISRALAIDPKEPELLRMFSQMATRSAWARSDSADQLATPLMWEDDQYVYTQQRSPEELAQARQLNSAAGQDADNAANALQAAVDNTKGTAAGFYYQAVQFHRERQNDRKAEASAAAAMEQAVKLAPNDVGYRDFLAELYSHMGWRKETEFFTQWSIADNLGETSAAKMIRLAWKQMRRREYDPARQSLAEAMRIDPADPRGPAYMGLLIAGENEDRAQIDQSASWLLAACALETANLRLWGLHHPTSNIAYTPDQIGIEFGLAKSTGGRLLALNRPQEALMLARLAIKDANRVEKDRWPYKVPTAMLPIPALQKTDAPHMDPTFNPPPDNTTGWVIRLHQMAGDALKAMDQQDEAAKEYAAAKEIQRTMLGGGQDDSHQPAGFGRTRN